MQEEYTGTLLEDDHISIPQEIIDEELTGLDETILALECARKKAPKYQQLDQAHFLKKMSGYLKRRGFPYHITQEAVLEVWQEIHKAS